MKKKLVHLFGIIIILGCICGMCSKGDESSAGSNNTTNSSPNNPVLKPQDTWVYFDDCPSLVNFYNSQVNATGLNKRPQSQNWIATRINNGFSGVNRTSNKRYLSWNFENSGNTRFLSPALNPSGKETFSFFIFEISDTPGAGTYTIGGNNNLNSCWYSVFDSSGVLHDSTRVQGISSSTIYITKMDLFQAIGNTVDRYKMSGTATFNIMYWKSGTASTTDIHTLQCTFNNVPVDFLK